MTLHSEGSGWVIPDPRLNEQFAQMTAAERATGASAQAWRDDASAYDENQDAFGKYYFATLMAKMRRVGEFFIGLMRSIGF